MGGILGFVGTLAMIAAIVMWKSWLGGTAFAALIFLLVYELQIVLNKSRYLKMYAVQQDTLTFQGNTTQVWFPLTLATLTGLAVTTFHIRRSSRGNRHPGNPKTRRRSIPRNPRRPRTADA